MGLVAVPADADADVVFGAKNLPNSCRGSAERFDFLDSLCQPVWHRFGPLQQTQVIVIAEAERSDPPLTFELAELKGLEREGPDLRNEFLFDGRRNEVGSVAQPFRLRALFFKQGQLLGHEGADAEYVGSKAPVKGRS